MKTEMSMAEIMQYAKQLGRILEMENGEGGGSSPGKEGINTDNLSRDQLRSVLQMVTGTKPVYAQRI